MLKLKLLKITKTILWICLFKHQLSLVFQKVRQIFLKVFRRNTKLKINIFLWDAANHDFFKEWRSWALYITGTSDFNFFSNLMYLVLNVCYSYLCMRFLFNYKFQVWVWNVSICFIFIFHTTYFQNYFCCKIRWFMFKGILLSIFYSLFD